jgi:hypothetical protein
LEADDFGCKGTGYPNVTISNSTHSQGVERWYLSHVSCVSILILYKESGNMLIMTYAYARASGDGSLISRYVRICTARVPINDQQSRTVSFADILG